MQYADFVGQVQHRAQLDSQEAALSTSRATLETLAERVQPGDAKNLAAQLPTEIGRHLERSDDADRFDLEEFYETVAERERVGEGERADVVYRSRVVIDVVDDAVDEGAIGAVRDGLPDEYAELFEFVEMEGQTGPDSGG
ncbi:DUF2267 domain-containing protein [Natronobiforma cellulositropha]|uniref:DUF2267 domain-containing protein n=1 Tax=Natronobiforma cellulositropha TaxID=1679076 RepID=UPI0021D5D1D5|nr:DUF2267 domain-containing protein [Natronobiforma cellulositropha]